MRAMQHSRRAGILALMRGMPDYPPAALHPLRWAIPLPPESTPQRMGKVELAAELFMTQDRKKAAQLAAQLCRLNRQRQAIEAEIYADAVAMAGGGSEPRRHCIGRGTLASGCGGHCGSRLAEDYGCPVFLICLSGDSGKASSRSLRHFHCFRPWKNWSPCSRIRRP